MSRKQRVNTPVEKPDWFISQLMDTKQVDRLYKKLDAHQIEYYDSIFNNKVTMVDAPAGTGKTTIAVMVGKELLAHGKVAQIVYIRFPDKRAQKQGFLPGDMNEKNSVYMQPFFDASSEVGLQPDAVFKLIDKGLITLSTDICMRGVNLKNTFLIIDEAQNGEIEDLRLMLTRLHDHSGHCVVIGHSGQVDNNVRRFGQQKFIPFEIYQLHMAKKAWTQICRLPNNYRGEISKWADNIQETINEYSA